MVTSRYDLKFLDCDVKPQTNQQTITYTRISEQEKKIQTRHDTVTQQQKQPYFSRFCHKTLTITSWFSFLDKPKWFFFLKKNIDAFEKYFSRTRLPPKHERYNCSSCKVFSKSILQ